MMRVRARPFDYAFEPRSSALVVIDMQRDFLESGGFGAALGNDVARLTAIVPTVKALLEACPRAGLMIIHTPASHPAAPFHWPPAKRTRRRPEPRIRAAGA